MYKLFLTLRYLRKRRIAYFAIAAVTLCVMMVLVVLSVMGGWLEMVKRQARGLLGDVIVDNSAYAGFPLYQEFIDEIELWPEVEKATPVLYSWGLYRFARYEQTGTVRVVGLRLDDVREVNAFGRGLFYDRYYPGTTHFGEQQKPLRGDPEPLEMEFAGTDERFLVAVATKLPPPYQQALEAARSEHAEWAVAHGEDPVLVPEDEELSNLNELLIENGRPPIPGLYDAVEGGPPRMVGEPWPGLILGRDIVAQRQSDGDYRRLYPRGELVTVQMMAASIGGTIDPTPIKQPFRYVDDSRTGIFEIDSQHIYCDFELLQQLLQMDATPRVNEDGEIIGTAPARCSQIQVKVAPGVDAAALTERLEDVFHSYAAETSRFDLDFTEQQLISRIDAMTWQESQAHIIGPVEKERVLVTILFGIISLVAVALILCILYMIVLQKTRDIGIIKAIGGSSLGVALIFVTYGAAVGITGSALGTVLGTLLVVNINEIQDFLIQLNPAWRVWDLQVYSFDRIPSEVSEFEATVVALCGVLASTIGSLAAAWRAGTMQPVEAIRHE